MFIDAPFGMGQLAGGQIRALAVTLPQRMPFATNIPTMDDAVVKGYELTGWMALAAPARTPLDVIAKLRGWMRDAGYGGVVLFDPYNQRYATGSRNMFGYFLRNSTRYFFIPTEGPIVLFEYPQSYHVSMVLDTIDEARPSKLVWSSVSGRDDETAGPFADEIAELLKKHGGGSMKLGDHVGERAGGLVVAAGDRRPDQLGRARL
eukprot:gene67932-93071_t